MTTLIIGASLSGLRAAKKLRELDPTRRVVLIDRLAFLQLDEKYQLHYQKILKVPLAELLAGVELLDETEVLAIDAPKKNIRLQLAGKMSSESYDQLIVATSSSYYAQQSQLTTYQNAYFYRTQEKYAIDPQPFKQLQDIAILGDSEQSLLLAQRLVKMGKQVTLFHDHSCVLFQFFDSEMVAPFEQELKQQGIHYYSKVTFWETEKSGDKLTALTLLEKKIPVDAVIYFAPTYPNTNLLQGIVALNDDRTVKTTPDLKTSDPNIYAVGDIVAFMEQDGTNKYAPSVYWSLQTADCVAKQLVQAVACDSLKEILFCTHIFDQYFASYGVTQELAPYRGFSQKTSSQHYLVEQGDILRVDLKAVFDQRTKGLLGVQLISDQPLKAEFAELAKLVRAKATIVELNQQLKHWQVESSIGK